MGVEFIDNTEEFKARLEAAIIAGLEEAAGEVKSQAIRNTRVLTGETKNSWEHEVVDSELTAYIGSNHENAIWEEFGTGEYALNGDGRKGGWVYRDKKGKRHFTRGKTPSRAFWKAYTEKKITMVKLIGWAIVRAMNEKK